MQALAAGVDANWTDDPGAERKPFSMQDALTALALSKGLATAETLHPGVWGRQRVGLLSVDSIKRLPGHWSQLAGLQPMLLQRGAVLAFLDGFTIHGFAPLVYK